MEFDYTKEPGKVRLNRNLNTEDTPLVSIITPYYNAGKYFEQTFNCVMNQTFPWFEWIIVNDGSTKSEDVELIERLAATDKRVRVLHKENGGISTARNMGIRDAKTDIIIPLDADDLIVPTFVEVVYWGLYYNPEYSWCYTDNLGFQNQEYLWKKPFDAELLKTYNFLTYCGAIRKSALMEVGCYDEITKHYFEDWRTWLKLLSKSMKPVKASMYGFWYRRLDTGVLSIVTNDKETKALADRLISEVAETADGTVKAKEYPVAGKANQFIKPKLSTFDRKVFQNHDKINVMMLVPWMEMGGADLFNLDVVRKLNKDKFELSILTTVHGENTWRQKFEDNVTDIFELPAFLDKENYAEFISYFIKSREIDVIFLTNSYYGYYLVPWLRKHFPDIAIIDYVHMEEWYWRNGGYARTSGVMGSIIEKTYVCNERTRSVMIRDFGRTPESVETLYIGVDHDKYNADKVEYGIARQESGIIDERPLVLFPCRIHPQKRPFLMLEIAEQAKEIIPNIAFVVVGDGWQLEELQKNAIAKGLEKTVYFMGRKEDMLPYYKDADITLICSIREGLSLTAYESLSMSTPVISSDVGGQKELIDDTVGRLIPVYQDETLDFDSRVFEIDEINFYVDAIVNILADKIMYKQLCTNCRNKIENGFSTATMIAKLEEIFINAVTNANLIEKRRTKQQQIVLQGDWAEDYYALYVDYENKEFELHELWESKQWLHEQYHSLKSQNNVGTSDIHEISRYVDAEKKLAQIYNMRTWKLIQKYRYFMDETVFGKILSKVRDGFRR